VAVGGARSAASDADGSRLSKLYRKDLDHAGIVSTLDPVFAACAAERHNGERFGEFVIRAGFVARSGNGRGFHADLGAMRTQ
jgi:sulfite reductase (NADPH) hemoprotein beta-component